MKKYRVIGSSDPAFMNIEMNIVFDDISMGKTCEVFGTLFTITQTGKVVVLSSPTWVLSLQLIPVKNEEKSWGHRISDPKELRVNHEVDVFLGNKTIRLTITDRLQDAGITFECLFKFLRNEWKYIEQLSGVAFPFEYDKELKLFTMRDEWNFEEGSERLVFDGSFSRWDAEGRCI